MTEQNTVASSQETVVTKIFLIGIIFWFLESWFFGWNQTPSCTAESICDLIARTILLIGYGKHFYDKGYEKGTKKNEHDNRTNTGNDDNDSDYCMAGKTN